MTKVTIRIHKPTGLEFKTKKIESDGRVTLIKDARKKAEWRPKIKQLEPKIGWFGRTKFYADVLPYAEETFIINSETNPENLPKWDKDTSKAFITKKILDKAGEEMKDKGAGAAMWVLGVLIIINMVLTFLLVSGRLRL